VQIDSFAIRLRPRSNMEAADLGVRLCQSAGREVFTGYWLVGIPVTALALASFGIAAWLPMVLIWLAKPWLDRSILFVLSRAAFGQKTTVRDLLRSRAQVWWRQLMLTWTWRRLSPWRAFTQPVYQLEGLRGAARTRRIAQIRYRHSGAAAMLTSVFGLAETCLYAGLVALAFWLAPRGYEPHLAGLLNGAVTSPVAFALQAAYAAVVLCLEPFYVAAGFAMYLNRRAELEAWDIEQEFRRAFGR